MVVVVAEGPRPPKFIGTTRIQSAQSLYQQSNTPNFIAGIATVFPSIRLSPNVRRPGILTQLLGTKSAELQISKRVSSALKAIAPRIFDS